MLINTSISKNLITAQFIGSGTIFIKPTDIVGGGKTDEPSTGLFTVIKIGCLFLVK